MQELTFTQVEQVNGGISKATAGRIGFAAGGIFGAVLAIGAVYAIEQLL